MYHRGVVEILGDDFLELLEPVLLESGRGVVGRIAQKLGPLQGRVDPHQHARFVAAVVEVPGVGHHGRTQGVGSQGADFFEVEVIVGGGQRSGRQGVVVVEHYAAHGDVPAVEQQRARRGLYLTEARADRHPVGTAVFAHFDVDFVEVRVFGRPLLGGRPRVGDFQRPSVELGVHDAVGEDLAAVGSRDVDRHRAGRLVLGGEVDFQLALGLFAGCGPLVDQHAVGP